MKGLHAIRLWFRSKIVDPVVLSLRQGVEPHILARSCGVGFSIGLCPLLGISTGIAVVVLFIFKSRLHTAMTMVANLVAIPVELAMILPFMRFGEFLLRAKRLEVAPVALKDLAHQPGEALLAVWHAIFGWLIAFPVFAAVISLALRPAFSYAYRKYVERRSRQDLENGIYVEMSDADEGYLSSTYSDEDGAEHPAAGHLVQELAAQPTAPRLVPDGHPDVQRVTQASATRRTQSPQRQHSNPFV